MLPFLEPKKISSVILARRGKTPNVSVAPEVEAGESKIDPALKSVAEDLLRGMETKSVIEVAKALQAAHDICDQYDHEEGPHLNEEDEE